MIPAGENGGPCLSDQTCSPEFTGLACVDNVCQCSRSFFPCGPDKTCGPAAPQCASTCRQNFCVEDYDLTQNPSCESTGPCHAIPRPYMTSYEETQGEFCVSWSADCDCDALTTKWPDGHPCWHPIDCRSGFCSTLYKQGDGNFKLPQCTNGGEGAVCGVDSDCDGVSGMKCSSSHVCAKSQGCSVGSSDVERCRQTPLYFDTYDPVTKKYQQAGKAVDYNQTATFCSYGRNGGITVKCNNSADFTAKNIGGIEDTAPACIKVERHSSSIFDNGWYQITCSNECSPACS
jgi:hypothetical protein